MARFCRDLQGDRSTPTQSRLTNADVRAFVDELANPMKPHVVVNDGRRAEGLTYSDVALCLRAIARQRLSTWQDAKRQTINNFGAAAKGVKGQASSGSLGIDAV
jgi:hypothetical protein